MNRFQAMMPVRADFLKPSSLIRIFQLLDQDGSGFLNGQEVQDTFNQICGCEVQVYGMPVSLDLNGFRQTVQTMDATYPQLKVAANLMQYIKENAGAPEDPDPLCLENCTKLMGIFDPDGTGHLDIGELFQMFSFLGMHPGILIMAFQEYGEVTSPEELQTLLKEMNDKFNEKEIDEKIVQFLGSAAANGGGKPDTGAVEEVPEPEPDPANNKKALLVGINYIGKRGELGGCINDVRNQMDQLINQFSFPEENIMLLTEDQDDDSKLPTKANIQAGFEWLLDGAAEGDLIFFHYSGHGSQCHDTTGSEPDGKNECICPLDCIGGPWPDTIILDNEIYKVFFEDLPDGVKCLCVFDCCHSATVADLQCTRDIFAPQEDVGSRFLEPPEEVQSALDAVVPGPRNVASQDSANPAKLVWTVSGCQDNQTSADATLDGQRQGALSWALRNALQQHGFRMRYEDLLHATRKNLDGRFEQIPALSTSTSEHLGKWYMGESSG